jgi:hypothetical protein
LQQEFQTKANVGRPAEIKKINAYYGARKKIVFST